MIRRADIGIDTSRSFWLYSATSFPTSPLILLPEWPPLRIASHLSRQLLHTVSWFTRVMSPVAVRPVVWLELSRDWLVMRTCGISVRKRPPVCDYILLTWPYSNGSCVARLSSDPSGSVPLRNLLVLPCLHLQQDLLDPDDPTWRCPGKPRLSQFLQTCHKASSR